MEKDKEYRKKLIINAYTRETWKYSLIFHIDKSVMLAKVRTLTGEIRVR